MKIATMKECIGICRDSKVTLMVWGHRGIGKSSVVKQAAAENNLGFIDMRCSQIEASDIRGLPDRKDGRTCYLPPVDMSVADMPWEDYVKEVGKAFKGKTDKEVAEAMKSGDLEDHLDLDELEQAQTTASLLQPRLKRGILFLDELNRAQDDVLQAVFQLVLDRKIGQYILPPGWSIVVAGNFMEGYIVNGFTDPAFLDRFCHTTLSDGETTLDEWVNYMAHIHDGDASQVIEFASQNMSHLDGDIEGEMGFSVQPSRRSWDSIIRIERAFKSGDYSDTARIEVLAGLIGRELALSYSRYSCPVKPREVLDQGVEKLHGRLKKLSRNEMTGLMWGLVGFLKPHIDEKEKHADTALDFAGWMCQHHPEKDLAVAFCKSLVNGSGTSVVDHVRAAAISNPNVAKLLAKVGGGGKKRFIDRLNERPDLQKLLSRTAWGKD